MSRYGDLLESGLSKVDGIQATRLQLALPESVFRKLPRRLRSWVHHAWVRTTAGIRIRSQRADLAHVLDGSHAYVASGLGALPVAITCHDVIPLKQLKGDFNQEKPGKLASKLIHSSIRGIENADFVIADSDSTKCDLVRLASIDRGKISVVHIAMDSGIFSDEQDQCISKLPPTSLGQPFIFHIGNEAFYKNRQGVLRIFAKVKKQMDVRLVLAGSTPSSELQAQINELGIGDLVDFVANPDDRQISACYSSAALLLFPSIYEGFGWPPLEAMAHDCPVVCSNAASLPEVVGDAALLAPVDDEDQLAEHCISILQNPSLAESLVQKGRARLELFIVDKMIDELTAVYSRVLDNHPRGSGPLR